MQHGMYIAIEIAHQHHRQTQLFQLKQDLTALGCHSLSPLIEVIQYRLPKLFISYSQVLQLQAELCFQRLTESEVWTDNRIPSQRPFCIDIRLTELSLGDWHPMTLIGMPEHLSPVLSSRVESASVVKDISCRHAFRY